MLPKFLQSSLKTYKEDTNAIAAWLALKAKQCGYPSELLDHVDESAPSESQSSKTSKRLKSNARKKAKIAAKKQSESKQNSSEDPASTTYIIKVKDFTTLADFVASFDKPVVRVPQFLVTALNRAIDLRTQHGKLSRGRQGSSLRTDQSRRADEGHSYFLDILEQTREILKPRMSSEVIKDFLSKPIADPECQTANGISNKFAELDVQEPSQAFVDAPDVVPEPKPDPEPRYVAETVHSLEEQYLAAHCLFEDVSGIRSFLRHLWKNYQEGMNIVAVSVTTNTAIDFVRSLERDYLLHFPEKSGYEEIMELFYEAQCLQRGQDPGRKQQPGDSFNFAVYDLAELCLLPTYIIISSVQDAISPGSLSIYEPGHFGQRDLRRPWAAKTPRAKFQDDKLVMLEAFPDIMLMTMITSKSPLAEDELLRGFRDMAPGKEIPLWLVFAAQCFLDIQHELKQDVSRAHAELMNTATHVKASIKQNLGFHEKLRIKNWPRTNDFRFSETLSVIEEWVVKDMVAEKLRGIQRNMPVPEPEPFRLLKQYPLLCGLFIFSLKFQFQELSIAFANAWGSVLYTGHLYNAVRQEKLLPKIWKDMELVISMHSTERMFVGGAPHGLEDYLKRFLLSMGYSAAIFSGDRRGDATAASSRGPRFLMELAQVGTLFSGRYCQNEQTVLWKIESIQAIIDSKMTDDDDENSNKDDSSDSEKAPLPKTKSAKVKQSATGALLKKPKRNMNVIPTIDFLSDLANALHAETMEFSIDYLRLHRFCWMLLRRVNEACKPKLLQMYGPGYLPNENQLPYVVGYIFMTATTTSRVADVFLPRRGDMAISSQLLATAADCIMEMIETGAGAMEIRMLEKLLGYKIPMVELENIDVPRA